MKELLDSMSGALCLRIGNEAIARGALEAGARVVAGIAD